MIKPQNNNGNIHPKKPCPKPKNDAPLQNPSPQFIECHMVISCNIFYHNFYDCHAYGNSGHMNYYMSYNDNFYDDSRH